MGKLLSRSDVLAYSGKVPPTVEVEVPEWGGSLLVRRLTAREADQFEAESIDLQAEGQGARARLENLRARFLAACVCDERGEPVFTADDVRALGDLDTVAVQRVYAAAERHNAMDRASRQELLKNSSTPPA